MRLTKVIGLAAVAAVAAMAFVGTSSAFGQAHQIVFCKELVPLCPNGKLWPAGTELLLLAPKKGGPEPTILGTLNAKCPDSLLILVTENTIGTTILAKAPSLEFGKLPTPKLGEGCTNCEKIHVTVPIQWHLEVKGVDEYFWRLSFKLTLKNCIGLGIECVFEGTNIVAPTLHTGEHPKHLGSNLAIIHFKEVLIKRTGGSAFCGSEGKWDAEYVLTLAHFGAEKALAWPSLDKP